MEKFKKVAIEIGSYILIILLVVFIKVYVVSPIRVNGSSMNDTLMNKDIMILNQFIYRFQDVERFDIVVVEESDELLIKRVIGLPGETVKCVDGEIFINDEKIDDKYASSDTNGFKEVKLGKDEYFVLGDNREVSLDSRTYGAYKKSEIKGKASFTIFPFVRFGEKE